MVGVRKAIEATYFGRCHILEMKKVRCENQSTGFVQEMVAENIPCKLSFGTLQTTKPVSFFKATTVESGEIVLGVEQEVTLFLAPDIKVKASSFFVVTQAGVTNGYEHSGIGAVYDTHQEIKMRIGKDWC